MTFKIITPKGVFEFGKFKKDSEYNLLTIYNQGKITHQIQEDYFDNFWQKSRYYFRILINRWKNRNSFKTLSY